MDKKIYFHELPAEERKAILESKMTVGAFMEKYSQPDWCTYPEALASVMGCWSLVSPDIKVDKEYCTRCDLFKPETT